MAEAAERFGSGEVTMTTRLTLEIQGVRYDSIDTCIGFLQDHGLDAGGTVARLGFDYVQEKLLTAPIDKDAILAKQVVGGATC